MNKRRTDRSWIAYGDKSHEDFNRRLAERGKASGKSWIDRPWSPSAPTPNVGRAFQLNRDPFIRKQVLDAERQESRASGTPPLDVPKPALRPKGPMRSAVDRAVLGERWLAAQREAALAKAPQSQKPQGQAHELKKKERER